MPMGQAMTNKPMLSVEREMLERWTAGRVSLSHLAEMRALLDKPDECRCKRYGKDNPHWPCPVHAEPSAQHHGEPVAWQFYQDGKWWNGDDRIKDHRKNTENSGYKTRELYAEQPAPVADHTQCEECKGWGYHENHYEGGGTECGECGGSGNALVAVVMPERRAIHTAWDHAYNSALDDVDRLNVVKP